MSVWSREDGREPPRTASWHEIGVLFVLLLFILLVYALTADRSPVNGSGWAQAHTAEVAVPSTREAAPEAQ